MLDWLKTTASGTGKAATWDCCVTDTKFPDIKLVQTTDFFYPLVDDPYMQGRIGCANVLSDLYSMGIDECDNMLMILAASRDMDDKQREVSTKLMMRGFNDLAHEAGTDVTGGQTVLNPWPIIGGVATSVVREADMIRPTGAQPGDVLVLTKPLGTQCAVNAHQWLNVDPKRWARLDGKLSAEQVRSAYRAAMASMARLNRTGARLMRKYGAHAATDVTGFGIMGHAKNLAASQDASVTLELDTLPLIAGMRIVNDVSSFPLLAGYSAETSGGLLVALPSEKAAGFCDEIQQIDGQPAWVIGRVVAGERTAKLADQPRIIEVPH